MSAYYRHQVRFVCPDTVLDARTDSPIMREVLDFIGDSDETHNARRSRWIEMSAAYDAWRKERNPNYNSYSCSTPRQCVFDFNRIVAWTFVPPHELNYSPDNTSWKERYWGCESNAINPRWTPSEQLLMFETLNGTIEPLLAELHRTFPEVTIQYDWNASELGLRGGCEFLSEADWDESDISERDAWLIEHGMKQKGELPKLEWEAGKPYNEWKMQL